MKFGAEENGVNARALEVRGQGVKFAAGIGQLAFVEPWGDNATPFDADVQTVERSGGRAEAIIGLIKRIDNARVQWIVKALGARKGSEREECQDGRKIARIFGSLVFARGGGAGG